MNQSDMTGLVEKLRELLAKATPGPWIVNPFCAQIDCDKPSKIGGLLPVAQMLWPTDERSEAETEANARLIVEAVNALPTLLSALSTAGDFVLVPREPTEAMLRAGAQEKAMTFQRVQTAERDAADIWTAMLSASLDGEGGRDR